jgi:hypothetical protein
MPRLLRAIIIAWLVFQGVLLAGIIATHGPGMEPDLRLLAGAAMAFASFPLSLATMYGALVAIDQFALQGHLLNGLITWASCFAAGALELWLVAALVKRFQTAANRVRPIQP